MNRPPDGDQAGEQQLKAPITVARDRLGELLAGCELHELSAAGASRPHYYRGVLRDLIGNLWECQHQHANQDDAHACAKAEYQVRVDAGEVKSRRR